ncbi:MAG: PEGA domain-containing protein, partial [Pseudomonadota bacterium]
MSQTKSYLFLVTACLLVLALAAPSYAGRNEVLAELQFKAASRVEKSAGVWVDGQYLGFLKELKRKKKVVLLPGPHQISIRRVGYENFDREINFEPGQVLRLHVAMNENEQAEYPVDTARVRVNVEPNRAAVFVDDKYVGYVDRFDGRRQGLLVAPGKRRFKVTLPGYQTFETEMTVNANQDYEISTTLQKGSIKEADA